MEELNFIINEENKGERIDKYISNIIDGKSRSFLKGLIDNGSVTVNGKVQKSNYNVKCGDNITVVMPEPMISNVTPENIELDIVYEDEDLIVINKPKGMIIHPAPGVYTGTLVNALLYHCKNLSGINGVIRPGIVHRIDKDTTGIIVVAKNDEAHAFLSDQFKEHTIKREYYALVEGKFMKTEGSVDKPLGRHKRDRIKMAITSDGKRAVTHYEVLEQYDNGTSLVKCSLETGRTHQIRVHMASISHPVVGDTIYGLKKPRYKLDGQVLHAKTLGFIHPTKKEYMEFNSELPSYYEDILTNLRK
ncbi:RluA family pseudouridine synthase [Clostridium gasigenes]|uniref:RluA family pseudouridine synthase n=1 Tax=Clostridium gasigenes TaxID=94869 RepID=UPI0014384591|nr:RluA family pseudouridine synthase [Clostridium gasigenes]NKF05277.1 RluA family pseudouridine synthase [Clostridium gasigenes]QSW18732.1 RluA family pseudouridine synthase [Clostridium gasigenes]